MIRPRSVNVAARTTPRSSFLCSPTVGLSPRSHDPTPIASHAAVTPPLSCASCHMPLHTYMVVDQRHDHSFRVPRPDLSPRLGTPNACNDCHKDKPAEWAASAIERWQGPEQKGFQAYGEAFHAAWTNQID